MTATNKSFNYTSDISLVISDLNDPDTLVQGHSRPVTSLLIWIQQTGILSSLTYSVSSKSEKSSNVIRFSLSDDYQSYYPLLRGFLSMGTKYHFRTDVKAKAFSVELGEDQFQPLKEYLKQIVALLKAEVSFKKALKQIIAFEKKIAGQQAALQTTLQSSLAIQ